MKRLLKVLCCSALLLCGCRQQEEPEPVEEEKISIVSNDIYADPKNPSNAYAKVFNRLAEDIRANDMDQLSEDVAVCFVYDFFTLKNKEDSTDIGGLAYLPQNRVEEFTSFAQQHFYRNYDSIVTEQGEDALPEVVNVIVDSKTAKEVSYLDETYDGYEYEMSVEYADTSISSDELKTKLTMTCLVYNGKAMVIAVS
ncbi:hypothetical protein [uncultured Traorella sp.]|uniref:hypothetical protein n=1 Tax=uncultured Traorella sp. TaxID=1929048 RepID=UPI0025D93C60|nr:hypothetical protein [uncultured Traorella sp.]